ncbi:MAG: glutaredoxin family protein [Candidatus Omnitrophica bacterium]|nr:glutaredoxin family protein [Candidatus Omnitrophota bacterium]
MTIRYDDKFLIFGHEKCMPCKKARKWFEENGINYRYIDVTEDENRDLVQFFMVTNVPVIVINKNGLYSTYYGWSEEIKKKILNER